MSTPSADYAAAAPSPPAPLPPRGEGRSARAVRSETSMRPVIALFTEQWTGAVKAFNSRLRQAGVAVQFPESPLSPWLPKLDGRKLYEEYYLALEDGLVRGAYVY